jgi:hypothetical protein
MKLALAGKIIVYVIIIIMTERNNALNLYERETPSRYSLKTAFSPLKYPVIVQTIYLKVTAEIIITKQISQKKIPLIPAGITL